MSDTPQGPGWWQASDNRWYPPELRPAAAQPSAAPVADLPPAGPGATPEVGPLCVSCGKQLAPGSAFCSGCGAPIGRDRADADSGDLGAPPGAKASRRFPIGAIVGICSVAVAAAAIVGFLALSGGGENAGPSTTSSPPTTEQSLASRTTELGDQIDAILCGTATCVDSTVPGVIKIDTKPDGEYGMNLLFDQSDLEEVAASTGVWSVADAIRMGQTRALDGTRESANGAVSWTYHPDSGLDVVIDVTALPTRS